jgi:tRNA pseudouridine55 synthase
MIDGILNLNKPRDVTSHDAVSRVRAAADQRRVGHAGTLDPTATGVLLICLGRATRMAEYLVASHKLYRAQIRLGAITETYDSESPIIERRSVNVGREEVEEALEGFRGRILQVPPMYSALKHKGKPLYKLAREGVVVEREPRPVEIHRLELVRWKTPNLTLEVTCSPGTYIRSLAHDLGQALECGAYLAGLVRLASGAFRLEDAVAWEDLTSDRLPSLVLPMDVALSRYPAFHLDRDATRAVRLGQALPAQSADQEKDLARAYGPDGEFLAVLEYLPDRNMWHPRKVFRPLG